MDYDAASVDAGPGASVAESLPARAQALPAETRSPSTVATCGVSP
jgi:hypothetical protein